MPKSDEIYICSLLEHSYEFPRYVKILEMPDSFQSKDLKRWHVVVSEDGEKWSGVLRTIEFSDLANFYNLFYSPEHNQPYEPSLSRLNNVE